MKGKLIIVLTVGNILLYSCQEKKSKLKIETNKQIIDTISKNRINNMINIKNIKKHIELQENIDSDEIEYDNPYNLTLEDLQLEEQIIYEGLQQNGFKNLAELNFLEKVKEIFNINITENNCNASIDKDYIVIYGYNMDIKSETLDKNKYDLFIYNNNLILSKKNKLLFHVDLLSNLIQFEANNSNFYKIRLPQYLISRNKYLFNDDKSQFPWLINNDEYFMENLVTTFGYTEDKKLLKWAFEKQGFTYRIYPPDDILQKFGKFLWTKLCNGEVKIHLNSLNLIKDLSNPSVDQEDYILFVAEYINFLTLEEKVTGLTFEQKARIIATLLEFGEQYKYDKAYGFNQMFLGKFIFYQDFDKLYKKEFEKNNYYNLPNLKHWYLLAEKEKDMFVNDMTLSDVPQPRDYLFRATYYTHH